MEFVPCGNLKQALINGKEGHSSLSTASDFLLSPQTGVLITEKAAKRHLGQLASGLKHMFDADVFHRDIKPENILIDENKVFKFADFGSSRELKHNDVAETTAGTDIYETPEKLTDENYTKDADIWSTGIVLYQMFVGIDCFPFGDKDPEYYIESHQYPVVPQDVSKYYTNTNLKFIPIRGITVEMNEFLKELLEIDPNKRLNTKSFFEHHLVKRRLEEDKIVEYPVIALENKIKMLKQEANEAEQELKKKRRCN